MQPDHAKNALNGEIMYEKRNVKLYLSAEMPIIAAE
jgi:hypothetical protein